MTGGQVYIHPQLFEDEDGTYHSVLIVDALDGKPHETIRIDLDTTDLFVLLKQITRELIRVNEVFA